MTNVVDSNTISGLANIGVGTDILYLDFYV